VWFDIFFLTLASQLLSKIQTFFFVEMSFFLFVEIFIHFFIVLSVTLITTVLLKRFGCGQRTSTRG